MPRPPAERRLDESTQRVLVFDRTFIVRTQFFLRMPLDDLQGYEYDRRVVALTLP